MSAVGPVSRTLFARANSVRVGSASKAADSSASPGTKQTTKSGEFWNWRQYSFEASFWTWVRTWFACARSCWVRDLVVGRLDRVEVRRQRDLGVDDDLGAVGQVHDEVGALQRVVVDAQRQLLVEVAVLGHAGHLDDLAQLQLAPSTARLGAAQRGDEVLRLDRQLLLGAAKRVDLRA